MQSVTEIRTLDELAMLRFTWKSLWESTPDACFQQSYDWVRNYLRFYGEGLKLRTLIVTESAQPTGLVPLVVRNVRTQIGAASVLTWAGEAWAAFLGPLGGDPASTMKAVLEHLKKTPRDWNVIDLAGMPPGGKNADKLQSALRSGGLPLAPTGAVNHAIVQINGCWDDYLLDRPAPWSIRYAQAEQAVRRAGQCSFLRWRPSGSLTGDTDRRWDYFSVLESLHPQTETSKSRATIELGFLRDVHAAAVDAGSVEICMLNVAGKPAACAYCYIRGGTIEPIMIAGNAEFGTASMQLLMCHMLRDSFSRGDQKVVFRADHSALAGLWSNQQVPTANYGQYAWLSPQAQALRARKSKGRAIMNAAIPMSGVGDTSSATRLYDPS